MENIRQALIKLFDRNRIVFWYDEKNELRSDYEILDLPEVEKIELKNNEFGVKYRVLKEKPDQKFLLYHDGPRPADIDNWLLDVQLAHEEFRTDQMSIWLSELGLGPEFKEVIQSHPDFFNSIKRRQALKHLLKPGDTRGNIRIKMLAVCVTSEPRMAEILESLLGELADENDDKIKLVQRCGLEPFLWEQLKQSFDYNSETPGIKDFAVELFKSCYAMGTDGQVNLSGDALVFMNRWKDSIRHHPAFEKLSTRFALLLNIEQDLQERDYRKLAKLDYFRLIDLKIINDLVISVTQRTITAGECEVIVRQRRQSHWYKEFQHLYQAVDNAARFIYKLNETNLAVDSMANGIERYSRSWFILDQLYRRYILHVHKSGHTSLMEPLTQQIENLYVNNYLLKVNDNWQQVVDTAVKWDASPVPLQKHFFDKWVRPFPDKDKKISVIISDALRYEAAEELLGLVRQEDRYEARLEPMLSLLPSYTQLGMAALLPNREISIAEDDSGTVFVDGKSSQGTGNRKKILEQELPGKAAAVKADHLLKMNKEECRAIIRDHAVVFVYHNRIDAAGDKKETEEQALEAVEETLEELVKVIKKLTGANATNLLVTADHGFIYQDRAVEESDFIETAAANQGILYRDRRFILGKGLSKHPGLKEFRADDIGLAGEIEIQIPKSIKRLRLQGSGSRYVHGGSALQEVVVPVLHINKKRQSDITAVEVEIFRGATSVITSGQMSVVFYQAQPVSDKVQPRLLHAGIYNREGELISDSHRLNFDLTSENPREREMHVRFVLTKKAEQANGQEVILRLEEPLAGTSHIREYKSVKYIMRRSFTSDFDF